ncbi:MAG: SIS domain-containing protein, partial [Planctomycetota bacterium]
PASPSDARQLLSAACDEWSSITASLRDLAPQLERAATLMHDCWSAGGKLLICGNGGSCADAMHFAEELVARFQHQRRGLAAVALADPTVLTCIGNDFGYDALFSRQVEALGRPGDLLVLLTTSGNSGNCVQALAAGDAIGMKSLAFLGKTGGELRGECDVELHVKADTAHRVQEAHKLLFHTLCEWADRQYADA